MKPVNPERLDNPVNNLPLDDEHANILIDFDPRVIPLHCLTETIEMAGATLLEIISLREEPGGNKSILVRLGTQDVRNAVLNLSKHPLNRVQGYNFKKDLNEKQ